MEDKIEEITPTPTEVPVDQPAKRSLFPRPSRRFLVIFVIMVAVLAILGVSIALPLMAAYQDGQKAYVLAQEINAASKTQDIKKMADAVTATKNQVIKVRNDLAPISWTKFIPVLGGYTADAMHLAAAGQYGLEAGEVLVQAVEPYADLLGLKGQGTFTGGTAEDRIAKAVETLDKVTPQIDQVAGKMDLVKKEIDPVDPDRYPETFAGKPVRSRLSEIKDVVIAADELLSSARPMVKQLPTLLGSKGEQKYMILFQNDAELRPTGGFITAYAIFRVEKGRIHLDSANDIYKLDDTLTKQVSPPDPIARYLNVYGWRMRDANFSPDFLSSMKTFEDLYNSSTAKAKIDGIIAMDTHVLLRLVDVMGGISAYGTTFTTKKLPGCDCPMIIYELEKYADEPKAYERGSRKDIIGVLLSEMLKKTLAAPKQVYGPLIQAVATEANEKHILIYLHNPDAQMGVEAINFAGRIKTPDSDYLHVNDANLGGAKANLYITESVKQDVTVDGNGANTTLTIDYRYPHSADNCSLERKEGLCLAGIYRDYLRVYLPKGAAVESATGFENKSRTFEDLGHTVVDGYFTVVPQGLAKITVKYKVAGSWLKSHEYLSLIQKQPGTNANRYTVTVNGKVSQFDLLTDKTLGVKL